MPCKRGPSSFMTLEVMKDANFLNSFHAHLSLAVSVPSVLNMPPPPTSNNYQQYDISLHSPSCLVLPSPSTEALPGTFACEHRPFLFKWLTSAQDKCISTPRVYCLGLCMRLPPNDSNAVGFCGLSCHAM